MDEEGIKQAILKSLESSGQFTSAEREAIARAIQAGIDAFRDLIAEYADSEFEKISRKTRDK